MNGGILIGMLVLPCLSPLYEAGRGITVVEVCPGTVQYIYQPEFARSPMEYARMRHLTEGPRDDRMPPEVRPVQEVKYTYPPAKKKKAKKKRKRK